MPSDTPGDDAGPGRDVDPDAADLAPSLDQNAEPEATQPTPDVDAEAEDEITEPIPIVGGEDTAESPAGPMVVGAPPPIDYGIGAEPPDRAGRNRRRALVAALVAAILALLG